MDPDAAVRWLESKWPSSLIKAVQDDFTYALGLKTGEILQFSSCDPEAGGQWVHLREVKVLSPSPALRQFPFERGIDVEVSAIAWVMDAPFGS